MFGAPSAEEFYVEVRLPGEHELRFTTLLQSVVVEVLLTAGDAEFCGAPLGRDVRYRVPAHLGRAAIYSWNDCNLRIYCSGGERAFQRLECYVVKGIAWRAAAVELHAALQEGRTRAQTQFEQHLLSQHQQQQQQPGRGVGAGPCIVIAGGAGTGRHALGMTLANLCARSPITTAAAAVGATGVALVQQQQQAIAAMNSSSSGGGGIHGADGNVTGPIPIQSLADTVTAGGCCTYVDCDPLHQTAAPVPLSVGAAVWEHTRPLDESSAPHMVTVSVAAGLPSNAEGSCVSYAYRGAVTKLLKLVRQRCEANGSNRAGWSGVVVVMPSIAQFGGNATAYAAMLYRACEAARADKVVLLGGSSKTLLARLHAEYAAHHGASFPADGGATLCFRRQLHGVSSVVELACMSACPSAVLASEAARTMLIAERVAHLLRGTHHMPLRPEERAYQLAHIDIAVLRSASASAGTTTAAVSAAPSVTAGFAADVSETTEVVSRVALDQFRLEGEGRMLAFYSSLHDCSNFAQPTGYGILVEVRLATREVVVRAPHLWLPEIAASAATSGAAAAAAFVVLPGISRQGL